MKTVLPLLISLVILPSALTAQDPRLANRLDPATRQVVEAFVDSCRVEGLPTEPLIQKALEGSTKGASDDRIVFAVRDLAGNLRTVRAALGPRSSEQELVAGAAALKAGATRDALVQLRQARSSKDLSVPLAVLADLVALGVQVQDAYQSVLDLARRDAADDAFVQLKQRLGAHRQ